MHPLSKVHALLDGFDFGQWSKDRTSATFTPPKLVPALKERCERIVELSNTDELENHIPPDARRRSRDTAASIFQLIEKADQARRYFLNVYATPEYREQCQTTVSRCLKLAYDDARQLATDMERDYILIRSGRHRRERKQQRPEQQIVRAYERAAQFLGTINPWCQGAEARTRRGTEIAFDSPFATAFSIVGVLRAATCSFDEDTRHNAIAMVGWLTGTKSVAELQAWNDKADRTLVQVHEILRRARHEIQRTKLKWQFSLGLDSKGVTRTD